MNVIEIENLSKRFGNHQAVNDLTLNVPEGAAMALIGANGAGKTTTIRLLMNILSPDSGEARVLGTSSTRLGHKDFERIGYVSENQKISERLTVAHYFDYLRALYPSWDVELEQSLRRQLDLPADRKLGKLSHGMRMKVVLAAALPFRPKLLVLDEPLSGLDPLVRDEVMESILGQAGDTTILISSHELAEIEGAATHVAFMDKGRLLFQDSMEGLTNRFREVHVTLPDGGKRPESKPKDWLSPQLSGRSYSFIDTAFSDEADLSRRLSQALGAVERSEARPMSLRAISTALMRSHRKEG